MWRVHTKQCICQNLVLTFAYPHTKGLTESRRWFTGKTRSIEIRGEHIHTDAHTYTEAKKQSTILLSFDELWLSNFIPHSFGPFWKAEKIVKSGKCNFRDTLFLLSNHCFVFVNVKMIVHSNTICNSAKIQTDPSKRDIQ